MAHPRDTPQEIVIVGSGLSGLAVALHLKKFGLSSTIYEFRPSSEFQGGEIALAPNAVRVLDHIGIYGTLSKKGFNSDNMTLMNSAGSVLGVVSQGSTFGYPSLRLKRKFVREELLAECKRQGISIWYESKVMKLEEPKDEGGIKLYFEGGSVVKAGIVIGADGLRSNVRKYVNKEADPKYSGTMVLYGNVLASTLDGKLDKKTPRFPVPTMLFGKEGSFTIWPRDYEAQEIGYFANISLPDRSKEEWRALGQDTDRLREILERTFCQGGWPEQVQTMCRETPADEFWTWAVNMVPPTPSWRSPSDKVILIGDAAHAIPPSGGQGGAMSLEDAETLAYALSKLEEDPWVLQKWEAHRQKRVQQVIDFNNLTAKLREASRNSIIQWLRELVIWGVIKIKGPEGYRWLYGYDGKVEMAKL